MFTHLIRHPRTYNSAIKWRRKRVKKVVVVEEAEEEEENRPPNQATRERVTGWINVSTVLLTRLTIGYCGGGPDRDLFGPRGCGGRWTRSRTLMGQGYSELIGKFDVVGLVNVVKETASCHFDLKWNNRVTSLYHICKYHLACKI